MIPVLKAGASGSERLATLSGIKFSWPLQGTSRTWLFLPCFRLNQRAKSWGLALAQGQVASCKASIGLHGGGRKPWISRFIAICAGRVPVLTTMNGACWTS